MKFYRFIKLDISFPMMQFSWKTPKNSRRYLTCSPCKFMHNPPYFETNHAATQRRRRPEQHQSTKSSDSWSFPFFAIWCCLVPSDGFLGVIVIFLYGRVVSGDRSFFRRHDRTGTIVNDDNQQGRRRSYRSR